MTAGGISIHAVDVASGRPAEGLEVRLLRISGDMQELLAAGQCGPTGLFDHPTVRGEGVTEGCYIAQFLVGAFYTANGMNNAPPAFLDEVSFQFGVADARQHYHLPFKFTAWGYSLFRGGL
ncbi:hydroxyisourate hydrolase [Amaricoccus macauensis]|uniref:hydroxyisourate hydrolase n=1 Tax=Amaricoccus macauensis TaxID=57001 RepID=UPI003C7B690C